MDTTFLFALARQLSAARERLSLRTAGNLPSITDFVFALRHYIARCDRTRLETRSPAPTYAPGSPRLPSISSLAYYVALAHAAYASAEDDLTAHLAVVGVAPSLLTVRESGKWAPGYFVARDMRYDRVAVVVRGSKELADMVTNLSAEVEQFLGGYGHQGVVRSAYNLYEKLRPTLTELLDRFEPQGGLVIVGHSLGGAVASALTMLLRDVTHDREFDHLSVSERTRASFRSTTCYSFAPPPFLSEELAQRTRRSIVTLVSGLDVVPRLSAASLDRFLVAVSQYNWGRDVGESVGRTVENVATAFLDPSNARAIADAVVQHGVSGASLATGAISATARSTLERPGREGRSPLWNMALNATMLVSSLVSSSLADGQSRSLVNERRRPNYAFARQFGMSAEDIDRVLVQDAPREVFLAGRVCHLDRPVTEPATSGMDLTELPPAVLVWKDCAHFRDIEASSWMVHDHSISSILAALEAIQP